jgi:large subunit ribosomal protein L10
MSYQQREPSPKKVQVVEDLVKLMKSHKMIGLVRIEKVPAKIMMDLRNQLRGKVIMRVAKRTLIQAAMEKSGIANLTQLGHAIRGASALVFSDMPPMELVDLLNKNTIQAPAKGGDVAPKEILVTERDTKIAPGPIISELNQELKCPTMIKNGTVWIRADTVTHKAGELITAKQALLLTRLGISPITIRLDFYSAFINGEIIPSEVLNMNREELFGRVKSAICTAQGLALGLNYITPTTVEPLVARCVRIATHVALASPLIIPSLLPQYIAKAVRIARMTQAVATGEPIAAAPAAEAEAPAPETAAPPKQEESAGLGGLFDF